MNCEKVEIFFDNLILNLNLIYPYKYYYCCCRYCKVCIINWTNFNVNTVNDIDENFFTHVCELLYDSRSNTKKVLVLFRDRFQIMIIIADPLSRTTYEMRKNNCQ